MIVRHIGAYLRPLNLQARSGCRNAGWRRTACGTVHLLRTCWFRGVASTPEESAGTTCAQALARARAIPRRLFCALAPQHAKPPPLASPSISIPKGPEPCHGVQPWPAKFAREPTHTHPWAGALDDCGILSIASDKHLRTTARR